MTPRKHQQKFVKGYKDKAFLVHEGGSGKTVCACLWLKDGRDADALIICPKRVVKKWEKALADWGTKGFVVSKEQFKKVPIKKWSAVVCDEADEFASPLFTKNRSGLSESLYNLVKAHDAPIALLTATPIRSNPWNLHTLLCFLGRYIEKDKWRDAFFSLERRPYLPRPAWLPRPDWRENIRTVLEKYADIVLLKDCVDDLPPITEEVINIKSQPFIKNPEWEPMAAFVAEHRHNQIKKEKEIIRIGKEYRKVLVAVHFLTQIEDLKEKLSKDRQTFVLNGSIKDPEEIISQANKTDECFLIVQAGLGAGWEFPAASCVIFASMGYSVRNWIQMKYRCRRITNLHPIKYFYLIAGKADNAILEQIKKGKDFIPSEWVANGVRV